MTAELNEALKAVVGAPELLPCPFCGGTNIDPAEWGGNDGKSGPGCDDCGALAESAEDWNRRAGQQVGQQAGDAAGRRYQRRVDEKIIAKRDETIADLRAQLSAARAAPTDKQIISAIWDATKRNWKPDPLPTPDDKIGYFFTFRDLIGAFRAALATQPAPRECEYPHETDKCMGCGWMKSTPLDQQASTELDERALFEAIEAKRDTDLSKTWDFGANGEYANPAVENRWQGFKAGRATLAHGASTHAALSETRMIVGVPGLETLTTYPSPHGTLIRLADAKCVLMSTQAAQGGGLATTICPTCKGAGHHPGENRAYGDVGCDDCDGQGRIIVSRQDGAAQGGGVQAELTCPDCGVDRLKSPCPRMADECAMVGDAHLLDAPSAQLAEAPSHAARDVLVDTKRLDAFIDWFRRGGARSEIAPDGHIRTVTREEVVAWLDNQASAQEGEEA